MILERFQEVVKHACVDLCGAMPAIALKGSSYDDMLWLVKKWQAEQDSIRSMIK